MSGGHWEYRQHEVREFLKDVGNDGYMIKRFPKLAHVFRNFADCFYDIFQDLDLDLSGDSYINNEERFEKESLEKIAAVLKTKCKVKLYEVDEGSEDR